MGEASKIEWTHHTFNPWRGCTKATYTDASGKTHLHPGCEHCYAEVDMSVKLHGIKWGKGQDRRPKAESGWSEPSRWARKAAAAGARHRVFTASLSDVLDPEGLPTMRERLWDAIRQTAVRSWPLGEDVPEPARADRIRIGWPGLDWLLLTKRPENWALVPEDVRPLVWLGTSISDQATAGEWVPRLLSAEGFRYRFLSVEPLLGPVDLGLMGTAPASWGYGYRPVSDLINWVIVGGESGSRARPLNVEWVRSIVRQCAEAGVPCFVKQDSGPTSGMQGRIDAATWGVKEYPHGT